MNTQIVKDKNLIENVKDATLFIPMTIFMKGYNASMTIWI